MGFIKGEAMIKILIADDMQILRDLLKLTIEKDKEFFVVGCASNGKEAVEMASKTSPHIVLMDLNMPEYSGYEAIKEIKRIDENIKVIVLTVEDDEASVVEALENGADDYIFKNIAYEDLSFILRDANKNRTNKLNLEDIYNNCKSYRLNSKIKFTQREREVLKLVIQGMTNEEIAKLLDISVGRARNIVADMMNKSMVKNRTQLAIFGYNLMI